MSVKAFSVKVPASTANLGPGFDSVGLALDLYLTVLVSGAEVSESPVSSVEYLTESYRSLDGGSDNLLLSTMRYVGERYGQIVPPVKLEVETDIPLGRGLGSSASAIAAGIEIADRLLALDLSMQEKLVIGTELEGHPDNVSASLLGGLTISYWDGEELLVSHVADVDIAVIILVPPEEFLTTESRGLLSGGLSHASAARSSAAANVFSAAVARGEWKTAGRMMEKDEFHEPFRKSRFPDFDKIRKVCREGGAYGTAISGAGPSLFVAVEPGREIRLAAELERKFPHYECLVREVDLGGVRVCEGVSGKSVG
ncbi:homoserine kinase [Planococcus sp. CAU13]|uniref:homoserine kinase n=1 Tax=Planococcus sp. CAU13 TaxID=1541197 RepID=UPI00052FF9E8|nr:homoserine kinase [Planococcus sp. CAU13]